MIDAEEAVSIAEQAYPKGPEEIASRLGAKLFLSPIQGCDGWCLHNRATGAVIMRLNSSTSAARRRFSLAHELAHVLLGTSPELIPRDEDPFSGRQKTEKEANRLASRLLLPREQVKAILTHLPVDAAALKRLARSAGVSEVMVACRVSSLARDIGLHNAAAVGLRQGQVSWVWSDTLRVSPDTAARLLHKARAARPRPYREHQADGRVAVASVLSNAQQEVLFLQLLQAPVAQSQTPDERRRELEKWLFQDDPAFRSQLNGRFGYFRGDKHLAAGMSGKDPVEAFLKYYAGKWEGRRERRVASPRGRQWLEIKFMEALVDGTAPKSPDPDSETQA